VDTSTTQSTVRSQTIFIGFMLVLATLILDFIWVGPLSPESKISLQKLFALSAYTAVIGLVSAIWRKPFAVNIAAFTIGAIGVITLAILTIWIGSIRDPLLSPSGEILNGPIPLRAGWSWAAMAIYMIVCGAMLPFSLDRRPFLALAAMTLLRVYIWVGLFWQLGYVVLDGRFTRLFAPGGAIAVQELLAVAMVATWTLLLRGDRRWLNTLIGTDSSVSLARYILPAAIVPVLGAYLTNLASRLGLYTEDVAPLLNLEITGVVVLLLGSAALRSLWRERRDREILSRALDQSPVIVHDGMDLIEYWPQGCEALYEYTAAEAVGQSARKLLKTEYPLPLEEIDATLLHKRAWAGEVRQTTRSGRQKWVATRMVVVKPSEDPELKIVETLTDITDLKLTNAALRDAAENLTQAVATYELGMVDFDAETGRTRYSREFERIVGVDPGSLGETRDSWLALMTPEDAEQMTRWLREDTGRRATRRTHLLKVKRGDGQIRDLNGMLRYRYSPEGQLQRVVGIYMDVTEQLWERAEMLARGERLLQLQSELTHTSRLSAMGEMGAALAHELNQPLTAVGNAVGAIGLLLKDDEKPIDLKMRQQVARAAKHAEMQAVRAGEIVRRLREFISRGEADTQDEDLGDLIEESLALALPNPAANQIKVETSVAPSAARVLANRVQVQQVLVNLIRNAKEAMRNQTTPKVLRIEVTAADGMAVVRVLDTGPGLAPEIVDRLFSPFLSTKSDGMGVGLSICRRIIEAHSGKMWVEHVDGAGADFRFTLPLIPSEARYVAE